MTGTRRAGLIALWLVALAVLAFGVSRALVVGNDLRSFMPPAQTADQRLLLDQIGEGPAARLLLLAISAPAPESSVALSQELAAALRGDARFSDVLNGDADLSTLDPQWLPYRYLLVPTFDRATLDADYLRSQLEQRLQDLGSPGAELLKPLLPRDPTLETLALAQRWTPAHAPALRDGVWFSPRGEALLLVQTRAAGFDPSAQSAAIDALRAAFSRLPAAGDAHLEISGPGYFGAIVSATPGGVLGGITVILYGMIGLVGAKIWVENGVDFGDPVNLVGLAGGLIAGIGGVTMTITSNLELGGIALGTILVIVYFHLVNNLGPNRTHHTTPALSHPEDGAGPGPTHRSEPDQE